MPERRLPSPYTRPLQVVVSILWILQEVRVFASLPLAARDAAGALVIVVLVIYISFFLVGIWMRWRWLYYWSLLVFGLAPLGLLLQTSTPAEIALAIADGVVAVGLLVFSSLYSSAWAMYREIRR